MSAHPVYAAVFYKLYILSHTCGIEFILYRQSVRNYTNLFYTRELNFQPLGSFFQRTFDVMLCSALPQTACPVTWPRKIEEMVLKKLDFPAPTGPRKRTFAVFSRVPRGGDQESISFFKSSKSWMHEKNFLKTQAYVKKSYNLYE